MTHQSVTVRPRPNSAALCHGVPIRRLSLRSKGVAVLLVSLQLVMTGCYATMSMDKVPPQSGALTPSRLQQRLPPAYLTSIQVSLNGARTNLAPTFETRVIGMLQEGRTFSDVISVLGRERRPPNEEHFDLTLHVEEIQHWHRFGNGVKGFFIGLSLFLLTPALPLVYEHEAKMTVSVILPSGVTKEYVADAQGSTYYTMNKAQEAIPKLASQVVESCLVSLVNQLSNDRTLQVSMAKQ
jgi:hypothetical protein